MEVKTLLRLIKDDVAHLEGITSEFSMEAFPTSDEIDVALVRANALLKELDLLRKLNDHHESGPKEIVVAQKQNIIITEPDYTEPESFGILTLEPASDETSKPGIPELQDLVPEEQVNHSEMDIDVQQPAEEMPVISVHVSHTEEHFAALVEPAGAVFETIPENKPDTVASGLNIETEIVASAFPMAGEAASTDETAISPDVTEQREEILAEEFSEVKKTLNETLGESHQMVNDILAPEKSEPGYKLVPIDSIWDGIGINDRFLYVRELFANNSAKFESTVAALDELESIHDAVNYLKSNFKWNKTVTSQKFLVLVKRRFTKQ